MAKILHTADVHLGRSFSELGPAADRLAELHWQCFEKLSRLAVEKGALALVIAGDLFDSAIPPARLAERVRGVFKKLAAEGVAVVVAPGTHDGAASARSVWRGADLGGARVFRGARLGERVVVERAGEAVAFQGLSWDPQGTPAEFLSDYRRGADNLPEVLVLHGEVGQAKTKRGKDLPASAEELAAAGADYVALGHRHGFLEFRRGGRLWGAYSGTPFGLSFKEPELGPRRAALVELGGADGPKIEPVATSAVEWLRLNVDLGGIGSREELTAAVAAAAGAERLALVELGGAAGWNVSPESIEAELSPRFLHLRVEDASVEIAPRTIEELSAEQSVRGIFARRMAARLSAARDAAERAEVSAALREGLRALAEPGGGGA